MTDLITTDLVRLDASWGQDKHDVIRALAAVVDDAGRATDKDQLVEDAFARESTSATGLPGGIAIPHCRTAGVDDPDPRLRPARPAGRLRRQGRPGRPGVPHRRARRRRRRPPHDPDQAGPCAGEAGLHRRAPQPRARSRRSSTSSATSSVEPAPGTAAAAAPAAPAATQQPPQRRGHDQQPGLARGGHRLPDRHRAHLHGRRGPRGRRRARRRRPRTSRPRARPARTPLVPRHHRRRRRRHLRRRRRRPRPGPLRRQADGHLRRQAAHRRRRRDDRRGAALRRRPASAPRVEGTASEAARSAERRAVLRGHGPPGPDDRRLLHDPVRRGRRSADRARLPVRRLRDRRTTASRSPSTTRSSTCPTSTRSAWTTHSVGSAFFAYLGALLFTLGAAAFGFLVPGAGRLHRLRHRGPPRHRAGLRDGRHRRHPQLRLPRRHRRRCARRHRGPLDHRAGRCPPGCAA